MSTASSKGVWIGRVLSILGSIPFLMSSALKLKGGAEVTEGMAHLGLPETLIRPLAVVELACVVIYLIPKTAVLGAILLTGYLGGAILAHLRVGDPFLVQVGIGVLLWLGLYLRDPRLKAIVPLMTP